MSWDEFVAKVTGDFHTREDKFDRGPGFSLARFIERDGTINRDNMHVDALSGIALDFDKDYDPEEVFKALDGNTWLAYTTFNHTPKSPKWRVVIPFSAPIPARFYKRVRAWLLVRMNKIGNNNKADEQAKAVSNFYFLPGCPLERVHLAEWRASEGAVLDVPALSEFKSGTPQTRILGDKVDWTWLREKMRAHKDVKLRTAFRKVLKGEPYADTGERDNTMLRMCGALAGWAPAAEPAELATVFATSINMMTEAEPDDPPPDLDNIESKIARSQTSIVANAREENAAAVEQLEPHAIMEPVDEALVEEWATNAGIDNIHSFLHHLLLRHQDSIWLWRPDLGTWGGPLSEGAAQAAARQELGAVPGVNVWTRKVDGDLRMRTISEMFHEHGAMIDSVVADLRAERPTLDVAKRELRLVGAPRRPLEAQEDDVVDAWLRAVGGKKQEKLLDWIAGLTWVQRPNSVLFIKGDPGVGKGLLVRGLARVWDVDQPTLMKNAVTPHGTFELRRCPLVLIDEGKWDRFIDVTTVLREQVTQPSRTVNRKYHDPIELTGYLRFIVIANNFNIFANDRHSLTPADRDAIAERFLEIDPHLDEAQNILNSLDAEERDGLASEDRIARHALWLAETRKVKSNTRFIVPGEKDGRFAVRIITEDHSYGSWVIEWLARYLSDPLFVEKNEGGLVHRGGGKVLVSPEAVVNTFEKVLKNKQRAQSLEISNALRSLSTGVLLPLPNDRGAGFEILVEEVVVWAKEKGIGNPARIRASATEDRKQTRRIGGAA